MLPTEENKTQEKSIASEIQILLDKAVFDMGDAMDAKQYQYFRGKVAAFNQILQSIKPVTYYKYDWQEPDWFSFAHLINGKTPSSSGFFLAFSRSVFRFFLSQAPFLFSLFFVVFPKQILIFFSTFFGLRFGLFFLRAGFDPPTPLQTFFSRLPQRVKLLSFSPLIAGRSTYVLHRPSRKSR